MFLIKRTQRLGVISFIRTLLRMKHCVSLNDDVVPERLMPNSSREANAIFVVTNSIILLFATKVLAGKRRNERQIQGEGSLSGLAIVCMVTHNSLGSF